MNCEHAKKPKQVTRVAVLGPADFVCGLSRGGVVRLRPGVASPCLLTEGSSVLSQGFGMFKKVGVSVTKCKYKGQDGSKSIRSLK